MEKQQSGSGKRPGTDMTAGSGGRGQMSARRDFERLFDNFFSAPWLSPFGRGGLADPFGAFEGGLSRTALSVEVKESENAFCISAELPGVEEKDVDLTLDDGVLTISAEKRQERQEEKENFYLSERQYGSFRRSFRLPDTVDSEKISAGFDKGVLTVHLPKAKEVESTAKKIAIGKAGGEKKADGGNGKR